LQALQQQLGYRDTGLQSSAQPNISHQGDSSATEVKAILVGALAVISRDTPYTSSVTINDQVAQGFEDDLANSVNYFAITPLPSDLPYLEFKVPPPSAGNWQVVAVGLRTQPATIGELGDTAHKDTSIYYGFTESFSTYDSVGTDAFSLTLHRSCLSNQPPQGCASYDDSLIKDPVVTAAVEIIGVKLNGVDYTPLEATFPIVVSNVGDAVNAVNQLKTIREEIQATGVAIGSLSVTTTHSTNLNEPAACQGGTYSACQTQEYLVHY